MYQSPLDWFKGTKIQEHLMPYIFDGKNHGFCFRFPPQNGSLESDDDFPSEDWMENSEIHGHQKDFRKQMYPLDNHHVPDSSNPTTKRYDSVTSCGVLFVANFSVLPLKNGGYYKALILRHAPFSDKPKSLLSFGNLWKNGIKNGIHNDPHFF